MQLGLLEQDTPNAEIVARLQELWNRATPEVREQFSLWRRREYLRRVQERRRRRVEAKT
jgi:hypothetical protein